MTSAKIATISEPPPSKGREKKKKKEVSTSDETVSNTPVDRGTLYEVEVEDSVIFPEGGGQSFDTGVLRLLGDDQVDQSSTGEERAREYVVEGCLRRKLDSIHLVRVPTGSPPLEGIVGRQVELEVDWERRVDHVSCCFLSPHWVSRPGPKNLDLY